MIKVGIIGGAGYTAGELLRILLNHPAVKIEFVQSSSNDGHLISSVHHDLIGETEMKFSSADYTKIDVLILCSAHGKSKEFLEANSIPSNVKIIDLAQDFRINATGNDFIYGLPEAYREKIKHAKKVANPGCFATAIQLALLPLAEKKLLKDEVHINAITGSTGAGQSPSATTHFSWRNNNVSVYKAFNHQHLKEIKQTLTDLQSGMNHPLNFIPVRGNFSRGILAMIYTACDLSLSEAVKLYKDFYKNHPFVFIADGEIDLKMVVNTNKCVISVEKHNDKIFLVSAIDNLVKGASGQAIQNMNLMCGLDETTGLKLKGIGF